MLTLSRRMLVLLAMPLSLVTTGCGLNDGPIDGKLCGPVPARGYSVCVFLNEVPSNLKEGHLQLDGKIEPPSNSNKGAEWQAPLGECTQGLSISKKEGQNFLCNLGEMENGTRVLLAPSIVSDPSQEGQVTETFLCDTEGCPEGIIIYYNGNETRLGFRDNERSGLLPHDGVPGARLDFFFRTDTAVDTAEIVDPYPD